MLGQTRFSQKLFYNLSPEELVPEGHILRRFDSLISMDFLYEETKPYYSQTAQPPADPVVLLEMMLLGYLLGTTSERKFDSSCRFDVGEGQCIFGFTCEGEEKPQAFIKRVYKENESESDDPIAKDGTIGRH